MPKGIVQQPEKIKTELDSVLLTDYLDKIKSPTIVCTHDFQIVFANKAYIKASNTPLKKLIGQVFYKIYPITNKANLKKLLNESRRSNEQAFFSNTLNAFIASRNRMQSYEVIQFKPKKSKDISCQLTSKKIVCESVIGLAKDAIIALNSKGKIILWNKSASNMFGYSSDEAQNKTLHRLITPKRYQQSATAGFKTFSQTGKGPVINKTLTLEALHKDGHEFPIELSVSASKIDGEWYATGIIRDITEKKIESENTAMVQKRYENIVNSSADAIFIHDENGCFVDVNPAACKSLGYKKSELLKMSVFDIEKGLTTEKLNHLWKKLHHNSSLKLKGEHLKKNGKSFPVDISLSRVDYPGDSNHAYFIAVAHDLTRMEKTAKELKDSLMQTVEVIADTSELRDPYTAGHQRRVAQLSKAIGKELGLDEERIKGIYLGAIIHDIGKLKVPSDILAKPSALLPAEFELIKLHPEAGYELMLPVKLPWPVLDIIHLHHERLNGSGYPLGLRARDIPLDVRIVSVADVVEAMSTHRPYRAALGIKAALKEIEKNKGKLYDKKVVEACVRLFRKKGFQFED